MLIVVLVCLAVAAAISVVVARQTALEHRVVQMNQRSLQAVWLAEAGVERAAARLAADADYAGQTWTLSAKDIAGDDGAVVRIRVEPIADQPQRRGIRVEVDYGSVPERRYRQIKQITVDRDAILSRQPTKASD